MVFRSKKRGPTHEDALEASRSVMKRALIQLQFYCPDTIEEVRVLADMAMLEQQAVYKAGVLRAVD